MSIGLLGVVLLAAVLHAIWNAWVKSTGRAALAIGLVSLGWCVAAVIALPFLPWPARASWPYLGASVVIHLAYMIGLARLYDAADLSRAYVLVRAIPPLLVTVTSVFALSERLSTWRWLGVLLVIAGVLSVSPPTKSAWNARLLRALIPTVLTIAAYTLVDGVGARRSGSPIAYALVLSLIQGALYLLVLLVDDRRAVLGFFRAHARNGLLAGLASVVAYTSVLWCMTRAPIGIVAALRESSVLVASFLGAALLRERVSRGAFVGAGLVMVGAIAMH
ncbi:MAG: EamA family transporter [Polyangiales bacterium]